MIKNIVFDMGKVLIHWDPEKMLAQIPVLDEDRTMIMRELFQGIEWTQMDRGIRTEDDVIRSVSSRLPDRLHGYVSDLVRYWHRDYLTPMEGMGELVHELKNNGYRIYLLSNAALPLRSYFPRIPGSECFDGILVSAEEKLIKPQHEIFETLYTRFSLNPLECWFIDDFPPNIEGALVTGMRGTIFRGSAAKLRRELQSCGIRCSICE